MKRRRHLAGESAASRNVTGAPDAATGSRVTRDGVERNPGNENTKGTTMQNVIDIRSELTARAQAEGEDAVVRGLDKAGVLARMAAALDSLLPITPGDPIRAEHASAARDLLGAMLALESSIAAAMPIDPPHLYPVVEISPDNLAAIERHIAQTLDNVGWQLEDAKAAGREVRSAVESIALGEDAAC